MEGVAPFVYPEDLEPHAIDDVRRTKVRLEEYIRRRGKELTEVKRGRGGIRDVEFAVQLLQIVHGRRDPLLREPNTLRALAALADEGYVAQADAEALADAYRFLRRLEHRLQIVRDLQTHDLPADPHARTTLARSLGLADAVALQDEYERQTELVRGIHERLFYRPLLEAFAGPVAPSPGVDRPATEELLAGLGFASTVAVVRGAATAGRPRHADGQGARARVPGDGAGARAGVEPRCRRWCGWSASRRRWGTATGRRTHWPPIPPQRSAWRTWPPPARSRPTCSWRPRIDCRRSPTAGERSTRRPRLIAAVARYVVA